MGRPILHTAADMRPDRALALVVEDALRRTSGPVHVRVGRDPDAPVVEVVQEADPDLQAELLRRFAEGPDAADTRAGSLWCAGVSALSRRPTITAPWGHLAPADSAAGHGSAPLEWREGPRIDAVVVTTLGEPRQRLRSELGGTAAHAKRAVSRWLADWFPEPPTAASSGPRARIRVEDASPAPAAGRFDSSRRMFARPAGLPPGWYCWSHPRGAYTARMRLGVLPMPDRSTSGVTLVVDGRVVGPAEKTARVGFGTRGRARLPANDATLDRLAAIVWLETSGTTRVPVTAGDTAVDDDILDDIRQRLHQWCRPYVAYMRNVPPPDDTDGAGAAHAPQDAEFVHWEGAPDHALPKLLADPALAETTLERFAVLRAAGQATTWGERFVPAAVAEEQGVIPLSDWQAERRVQVPMSEAALQAIERISGTPVSEWMRRAAERELGRSDARWAIAQPAMRPVVDAVVARVRRLVPDAAGIAAFGSVVRGAADRGSDIDIWVIVTDDRNQVQRDLNDAFDEFRFPSGIGERYRIQVLVASVSEAMSHAERGEARFVRMLGEALWFERGPAVDEILRLGGTRG